MVVLISTVPGHCLPFTLCLFEYSKYSYPLATCEASHVLLAGVTGGFPGVLPFRPTYRLARLDMSEIIIIKKIIY